MSLRAAHVAHRSPQVGLAGHNGKEGLGITWQGDAPLLVLAGVLGSLPFLALTWWKILRPNRTTGVTGAPDDN